MTDLIERKESERAGAETHARDDKRREYWTIRQERFLEIASQAEAQRDYFTAGRAFVLALFCEGRLRDNVKNPWAYIFQAMPVY
jgi:hypothetical protein